MADSCSSGSSTDEKKRKRMQSNRESARRSRMRKQKYLDDLTDEINQLRNENNQILTEMNLRNHLYVNLENDNSILGAQMVELSYRLQSLNDIMMALYSCRFEKETSSSSYEEVNVVDDDLNCCLDLEDVVCEWDMFMN